MIYLGTSLVYKYLESLNINDLPRPTKAVTRLKMTLYDYL